MHAVILSTTKPQCTAAVAIVTALCTLLTANNTLVSIAPLVIAVLIALTKSTMLQSLLQIDSSTGCHCTLLLVSFSTVAAHVSTLLPGSPSNTVTCFNVSDGAVTAFDVTAVAVLHSAATASVASLHSVCCYNSKQVHNVQHGHVPISTIFGDVCSSEQKQWLHRKSTNQKFECVSKFSHLSDLRHCLSSTSP
jgi:hypothetical protein